MISNLTNKWKDNRNSFKSVTIFFQTKRIYLGVSAGLIYYTYIGVENKVILKSNHINK